MARNVFISFRFVDGFEYKEKLSQAFKECDDTFDFSESEDRSDMSEETIKNYLYGKLKRSSVTIVILSSKAINHQKENDKYNDWMYDEIRYSLENRDGNKPNGLIALYVPESENMLINKHGCEKQILCNKECTITTVNTFDNLCRKNMFNVKNEHKKNKCANIYDSNYDHYCSLISFDEFINNIDKYIEIAIDKRDNIDHYDITVDLNKGGY